MDRRNGGDPLAPPRPPKSLPRVHRPRAPEPAIMSSAADTTSTANRSLSNVPPQLSPKPRNLSSSSSSTTTTPAAPRSSSNISSSIPPPLPPQIVPLTPLHTRSQHHHQQHLLPSSHNNSSSHSLVQPASTFSRRRPPAALPSLSVAVSSSNNSNILGPPSLETSLPPAATSPVTLAAPRPENERLTNEYVDTPFSNSRLSPPSSNRVPRSAASPGSAVAAPHGEDPTSRQLSSVSPHSPSSNSSSTTGKPIGSTAMPTTLHGSGRNFNNNTINTRPNQLPLGQQHRTVGAAAAAVAATPLSAGGSPTIQSATLPITKQPVSNHTFSKDAAATATAGLHELDCIELHPSTNGDLLNSITCPHCKKCRCEECQRPRQLPSRWLCDNSCLCSAETIIDYASCLCVVKALYYHCSKDHEMERESDTISCAEDPCSCLPHKRTTRWGLLGALSLGLPCLWCYWPMRGCVAVCAKCYAKHSRHGCRCQLQNGAGSLAGSILGGPGQSANGTAGPDHAKFSAVTGTSPVFGIKAKHHHHSSHHHHHHHHSDLTPEKRLLDSSPEY